MLSSAHLDEDLEVLFADNGSVDDDDLDPALKAEQDREVEEFARRLEMMNRDLSRVGVGQKQGSRDPVTGLVCCFDPNATLTLVRLPLAPLLPHRRPAPRSHCQKSPQQRFGNISPSNRGRDKRERECVCARERERPRNTERRRVGRERR
jgi:hypothetical protein